MSNFFAALDDSGDEGRGPAPAAAKKSTSTKKEVVEPSKVEIRPKKNNDRNTKGGRGGRTPPRDGKRAYDRRSGTGRGREIKKEGGGGHNWGNNKNDAKKAEGPVTEGKEEVNTPENNADETKAGDAGVEEGAEEKVEEPEDKTLSYDEYMKSKQNPDSAMFKQVEIREVENEFTGKVGAKKETEDFLVMGSGKSLKKKSSKKEGKQTLALDFKIKSATGEDQGSRDGRRDGRRDAGRGGRGGGDRGGRREDRGGRREDRGGRREKGASGGRGRGSKGVDTSDDSAFPSL